jgi:ribose transport system substrate-binding protein
MKRMIVLVLIVAVLLSACAKQPAGPAATSTPKDKYVVGVSYEGPTNDWAASLMYHLQYSFDEKYKDKVEKVYYESADGDATKQVSQIENLLTKGVDALMIQPLSESALVNVVEKASGMNIPVIIFGSSLLTDKYTSYVDRDNYKAGKNIATEVCKALGGKGKVVTIMGEPGSGYSENVLRGVNDALKECPGLVNVGTEYGEYSAAVTKQKMETFLAANPDITGVIVDGGLMGVGVLEAYKDAGLTYPFMTVDDWNGFQTVAKKEGYTNYISIPGGSEASAVAADLLFKYLAGEQIPKEYLIDPQVMSGADVQAKIPEGMPDSYWALSLIPKEFVKNYYK